MVGLYSLIVGKPVYGFSVVIDFRRQIMDLDCRRKTENDGRDDWK